MNGLDLLLVIAAVAAAIGGWRLGFLHRLAGWIGMVLGMALAIVVLPTVVRWMGLRSDLTTLLTATALLVLLASVGQAIGSVLGARLRAGVESPGARAADSAGGSVLGVLAVGLLAWLVLPMMAGTSGWAASSARSSAIAGFVDEVLPDAPPQIAELERLLTGGQFPRIFAGLQQSPDVPPAPEGSTVSQEMLDAVSRSSFRLTSETCGRIQTGSGFVLYEDLVVTNAHVVAGADRVELEAADGDRAVGQVVAFDPGTDLALVAADLDDPPLELGEPADGDRGLVLGFPGGGPFDPSPFEVGTSMEATGYDIYDDGLVQRRLLALASALEPGDSGSAVLRDDGTVVGVAVAVAPDRAEVAYALHVEELHDFVATMSGQVLDSVVDTGPCLG